MIMFQSEYTVQIPINTKTEFRKFPFLRRWNRVVEYLWLVSLVSLLFAGLTIQIFYFSKRIESFLNHKKTIRYEKISKILTFFKLPFEICQCWIHIIRHDHVQSILGDHPKNNFDHNHIHCFHHNIAATLDPISNCL